MCCASRARQPLFLVKVLVGVQSQSLGQQELLCIASVCVCRTQASFFEWGMKTQHTHMLLAAVLIMTLVHTGSIFETVNRTFAPAGNDTILSAPNSTNATGTNATGNNSTALAGLEPAGFNVTILPGVSIANNNTGSAPINVSDPTGIILGAAQGYPADNSSAFSGSASTTPADLSHDTNLTQGAAPGPPSVTVRMQPGSPEGLMDSTTARIAARLPSVVVAPAAGGGGGSAGDGASSGGAGSGGAGGATAGGY